MSRSLCLLAISPLFAACSDDASCGSPGANAFGLTVSSDEVSFNYGNLTAGANNDCPDPAAPSGVVSLTITGSQMSATGVTTPGLITLCVPRPDKLGGTVQLGTDVKIVDLTAMDAQACSYTFDSGHVPTGTVAGEGVCADGLDKAGFGMKFDGFIGLRRTCTTQTDSLNVGITGNVAVTPNP